MTATAILVPISVLIGRLPNSGSGTSMVTGTILVSMSGKTEDRGHGLRANRTFEPGQVIIEYTGEIITQEESEKRMYTDYKDAKVTPLTLFADLSQLTIP